MAEADKSGDGLAKRVELRLAERGLTALDVSLRAGLNKGAVSDILSGRNRNPSAQHLAAIAAVLQCDIGQLIGGEPAPARLDPAPGKGAFRVLLIIGGGIAAYKGLDLIRRLKDRRADVRVVMTEAACRFVTPLAAGALSGNDVFTDLFDRASEHDVGHIRLAREADLIVVAPATADLMAKMAAGLGGDLATAILLATDRPVLLAPAMNPLMWRHAATERNVARLRADGIRFIGPEAGEMAEAGEAGLGRMSEPVAIADAALRLARPQAGPLTGRHVIVTSGPTHEPIDPVRYLANRSSGKQGHAIAAAAAAAGARVTLVSGPVTLPDPPGVTTVRIETARDMLAAVGQALPADIAVMAAAVADWRAADEVGQKIKKDGSGKVPDLRLAENPDILATIAHMKSGRPGIVVGFAAESENLVANAERKLAAKACDLIVANDISAASGVMGGDENRVILISPRGREEWPRMSKNEVAARLVQRIAEMASAKKETA